MTLYEDATLTDEAALLGHNCHIVAEEDDGPRGDASMPVRARNRYENLILLCPTDHTLVDAQPGTYTVAELLRMKAEHEKWVRETLDYDAPKQADDESYADIVGAWEDAAHVDDWAAWSSFVLAAGQPQLNSEVDRDLFPLRHFLLNRVWPGRYPELEKAFRNFRTVLQDFQDCFRKYSEPFGEDMLITRRIYQIDDWDPERYEYLGNLFDFHVDLVYDLMLELTRAANLICDGVRQHVIRGYRASEGRLLVHSSLHLVESGPLTGLKTLSAAVQYTQEERARDRPYPGLAAFLRERTTRDWHFGEGVKPPGGSEPRASSPGS